MKATVIALLLVAAIGSLCGEEDPAFHFEYDLAPYLARAGCAAADCHGGATGRGGFKLSLFATNARADYEAITQELAGRRIDYADPGQSLLLRKPTKSMKHGGGRVIAPDGAAYQALAAWIRDGTPFALGEERILVSLDLALADDQLIATAAFEGSDRKPHPREVTGLCRFNSLDERVAKVDAQGRITRHGPGETWIIARYGSLSARLAVRRSFDERMSPPLAAAGHSLDVAWYKRLRELGLQHAEEAGEDQFLRRLVLDLCGRPPAPDEIRAYFALPRDSRVQTTVLHLVRTDEFTALWTRHLSSWFEVPPPADDLRHTSDRNDRLRDMVREFVGSDDSLLDFGKTMFTDPSRREFVQRFEDPRDRAEFTGRTLLGTSIGCARCHNHPMDRWSQAQHLQFSACFTDQRPVAGPGDRMSPGMFFLPGDGQAVEPALLPIAPGSRALPSSAARGGQLAEFLEGEAKQLLARNAANRIFGIMMGRHLVESPDDHRLSNPAVHEALLEVLSDRFREMNFQLRPMIRFIATSDLYARASDPPEVVTPEGDPHLQFFARREARPMSGGEYLRAVAFVLGIESPPVTAPETPLAAQLQILNSGLLQQWMRIPGNQVDAVFAFESEAERQLQDLYLLILSRPPRPEERAEFLPLLADAPDPLAAGRDLAFALLASREFSSIR